MAYEVMIIGLDQVGASIGLALANAEGELRRVGYDADKSTGKQALELGAIDELLSHPRRAIKHVDLVILSIPTSDVELYLETLGPTLKEGALVLDTGGIKSLAFEWAKDFLPEGRHFIAAMPVVGPKSLEEAPFTPGQPSAELFQDGLLAITNLPQTPESALAVAVNLATLLGAQPFFIDPDEHDAAIAATDDLPALLSAALLRAATRSPSWRELQRLAGQTFAFATQLVGVRSPTQAQKRIALNREKVLSKLDVIIEELNLLREHVAEEDGQALSEYLDQADRSRFTWLDARNKADWSLQDMTQGQSLGGLGFFGNLFGISSREKKG
jgi:prephenate dehydrogenase